VLPTLVIGSQTLIPGVYFSGSSIQITGNLTLDAQDDPNAVFIFQAGSTLVTAISSEIILINGAQACNVYWQVGSSATLSKNSDFSGHVLAHTSITSEDGVSINGQLLAINGAVTLVNNTFVNNSCGTTSTSSPPRSVLASTGQAETTVSWLSPSSTGGSSITGYTANAYTASAYTQETGGTAVASCTATALTCQITGLSNGTPYYIRVSATNAMGDSAESSPAVVVHQLLTRPLLLLSPLVIRVLPSHLAKSAMISTRKLLAISIHLTTAATGLIHRPHRVLC
jgi:hypothetical protein